MREILFRGKCETGEWLEGGLIQEIYNTQCQKETMCYISYFYIDDISARGYDKVAVIPETVGQYTGEKDKNGTRIFEGDICLCNRNIAKSVDKQKFVIMWSLEHGQWIGINDMSTIDAGDFEWCEVIGNIHDNLVLR